MMCWGIFSKSVRSTMWFDCIMCAESFKQSLRTTRFSKRVTTSWLLAIAIPKPFAPRGLIAFEIILSPVLILLLPLRTLHHLSYHKRVKLFQNWCYGRYEEHVLFHQRQFNPSRIFLEKDLLYITHGGQLRAHKRMRNRQVLARKPCKTYGSENDSDITSFAKKDSTIFIGRRDGHVMVTSTDSSESPIADRIDTTSTSRLEFVDFNADLFVTTTLNTTSLWRRQYELGIPFLEPIAEVNGGGNKCLRLSPDGERLATGKYNERARTALRLTDIETYA